MVLLNIRLGYWLPNPGLLEEKLSHRRLFEALSSLGARVEKMIKREPIATNKTPAGFTCSEKLRTICACVPTEACPMI